MRTVAEITFNLQKKRVADVLFSYQKMERMVDFVLLFIIINYYFRVEKIFIYLTNEEYPIRLE